MRKRLLAGGVAAAIAFSLAPSASAAELRPACVEGADLLCTVIALTCVVTGESPCHP